MATFGTFADGVSLKAAELNDLFRGQNPFTAPLVYQSNLVTQGSQGVLAYYTVAKFVCGFFVANFAGNGTAGNRIEIAFPVAAASSSVRVIGSGYLQDSSASLFRVFRIVQYSTTRMACITDTAPSLTTYLGQTNGPAITLASNDNIFGSFMYEAA